MQLAFVAALVLTQSWFPHRYWNYALHFNAATSWLVLARDVSLLVLLGALLLHGAESRAGRVEQELDRSTRAAHGRLDRPAH